MLVIRYLTQEGAQSVGSRSARSMGSTNPRESKMDNPLGLNFNTVSQKVGYSVSNCSNCDSLAPARCEGCGASLCLFHLPSHVTIYCTAIKKVV